MRVAGDILVYLRVLFICHNETLKLIFHLILFGILNNTWTNYSRSKSSKVKILLTSKRKATSSSRICMACVLTWSGWCELTILNPSYVYAASLKHMQPKIDETHILRLQKRKMKHVRAFGHSTETRWPVALFEDQEQNMRASLINYLGRSFIHLWFVKRLPHSCGWKTSRSLLPRFALMKTQAELCSAAHSLPVKYANIGRGRCWRLRGDWGNGSSHQWGARCMCIFAEFYLATKKGT